MSLKARERNLEAAVSWLMRSIEVCDGRASSKGYRFLKGWMPPYPETTGYIIPTLLMLEHHYGDAKYGGTAKRIANWLCDIQLQDGGFVGREVGVQEEPDVFDTGMILLGFNSLIAQNQDERLIKHGKLAADFLMASQDQDGCFVRNMSHDMIHTYNVRAAWGMLGFASLTDNDQVRGAALRNIQWTLRQQLESGFFANNAFKKGGNANLHGTAYVMRALLQSFLLTQDREMLDAVVRAADSLVVLYDEYDWIASELGPEWDYCSRHICLTGYAQLAIILLKLSAISQSDSYSNVAMKLLDDLAIVQDVTSEQSPHFGGIAGSFPIYGRYAPLQYPNWATKFFIDAMVLRHRAEQGLIDADLFQLYGG